MTTDNYYQFVINRVRAIDFLGLLCKVLKRNLYEKTIFQVDIFAAFDRC